jgi:ABC-type sugar transport system ATPase subunit
VARFIGSPAVEFLGGTFDPSSEVPAFRVDGAAFEVPAPMAPLLVGRSNIEVAIRPEHVVVAEDGIAATIRLVQPVGASTFLTLALGNALLTARVPGMAGFRAGDKLHFRVDPANLMFFDRDSGLRLAAAA